MSNSRPGNRLLARAAQVALRYYLALRVSASTVTPAVFSLEHYEPPAPIVRAQSAAMLGRWDERELLAVGADHYVITARLDLGSMTRTSVISSN